jgi:hypothetical protein
MIAGVTIPDLVEAGNNRSVAVTFCAEASAEDRRYKKTPTSEDTALPMHCPGGQKNDQTFFAFDSARDKRTFARERPSEGPQNIPTAELLDLY